MSKVVKFKVSFSEFIYLTAKLSNEAPKGYIFNADKTKVVNENLAAELLSLHKMGDQDHKIDAKLADYIKGLVANVSPEYFKTLCSCVRSVRSRSGKKLDDRASSMTIDKGLQANIKSYIGIFSAEGFELTQSELVKIALESLTRERSNQGKKVPELDNDYSKMLLK